MSDFFRAPLKGVCANVHLGSGEDIIGIVTEYGSETRIDKPVIPNVAMDESRNFRVGLLPLRPYLGNIESVTVANQHVVYVTPCPAQMEKLYREFTSTITLASPSDVPAFPGSLSR